MCGGEEGGGGGGGWGKVYKGSGDGEESVRVCGGEEGGGGLGKGLQGFWGWGRICERVWGREFSGKGLGGSGKDMALSIIIKYPPFSDNYQSEMGIHSHSCSPMWTESLLKANASGVLS